MDSSLEDRIWESLFKEAQQLLREGKHEPALQEFKGALTLAHKFGEDDARFLQSLNGLALAHSVRHEFEDAEYLFAQAALLAEKNQGPSHPDVAKVLKHLALIYSRQHKYGRAQEALERVIRIIEHHSPDNAELPVLKEELLRVKRHLIKPTVGPNGTMQKLTPVKNQTPTPVEIRPLTDIPQPPPGPSEAKPPMPEPVGTPSNQKQSEAPVHPARHEPVTPRPDTQDAAPRVQPEVASSATIEQFKQTQPLSAALNTDLLIGTTIDKRYQVNERLADGGMSVIYKGWHTLMDRPIAIKVLHTHLVANERNLKRFQQEAKTSSSLIHQHIVTVRDFGVTPEGLCFMIMDFVEGDNLATIISKHQRLPAARFVPLLKQVCEALAYAHEQNILHRDLKPSNIMIEKHGDKEVAKIVDFGIAKIVVKDEEQLNLTQTGETVGSPLYMSPEQCRGEKLDIRADVYSLGCLAYKALAGTPPFFGRSNVDVYIKHVNDPVPRFAQTCPDAMIPEGLESVVLKALEKEPEKRHQNMHEFLAALEAIKI